MSIKSEILISKG